MNPKYFTTLSSEIIKSWIKRKSNYIVVSPPMSSPYLFFKILTDSSHINNILGERSTEIRIAILDTYDFKSEQSFAKKVCTCWNVDESLVNLNDPTEILNIATQFVRDKGKHPILIIKRFHEALEKLGEDIGTTLRNLEHDYYLKTVVELPVNISTLRIRREQENRTITPFLVSDWGQGHTHKLLKGYDQDEIKKIVLDNKLNSDLPVPLFNMTGGLHGLVESLIQEIENVNTRNFEHICNAKSIDLCRNIEAWFEGTNSSYYKKALIDYIEGDESIKNLNILKSHDWCNILINKKDEFTLKLLSHPVRMSLSRKYNTSDDIEKIQENLNKNRYLKITQILETKLSTESDPHKKIQYGLELAQVCNDLSLIYNISPNWGDISSKIESLNNVNGFINNELSIHLDKWKSVANLLFSFFNQKYKIPTLRVEQYVCETSDNEIDCLLLLLQARLNDADGHEPFYALQSVISHPESLLQIYCFAKFGLKFWSTDKIITPEAEISKFIRRPFNQPKEGDTLGFATLVFISTYLSVNERIENPLIESFDEMEHYLSFYELRKKQVHSTAFIHSKEWGEYYEFCNRMISKIRVSLNLKKDQTLLSPKLIFENYLKHLTYSH
ncbi:hypothetical protein QE443_003143 [Pantoea ananatis]|uniref:hypothetical protein n=1 Tax=Pantoea ananas TaxID=553 RepID=UPI0027827435|nr:hypothetical protein [Pantoea ananatis]MDQ1226982.1 hypothetical protein [Pantoea ananatis]MDR6092672.1 hypothetical protein [Pantoea ananatis]